MDKEEKGTVRKSNRKNKGILPLRYQSVSEAAVAPVRSSLGAQKKTGEKIDSGAEKFEEIIENFGNVSNETHKSVNSIKSKSSNHSHLNLQLEMVLKQKKLCEEEERIVKEKKELLQKEMELQEQLLELQDDNSGDDSHVTCQRIDIKDWVQNTMCNDNTSIGSDDTSAKQLSDRADDEKRDVIEMTKQCLENSKVVTKYLLRQSLKELIHFSGELTEWPIFINEYKRTTEMHSLTDEDNLIRLDRALKGKARETVRALLTSPRNVTKIIQILQINFGRPEWVILSLMDKVKRLSCIKDDKIESSILFSNAVNNMVTTMKNIRCEAYLFNPDLLWNLTERLTPIQKYSWAKRKIEFGTQGKIVSLEDFAEWFDNEINCLASISNPFQKISHRKENVMVAKKTHSKKEISASKQCVFCKSEGHLIEKCQEFLKKSVQERRKVAFDLKLCFICLKIGHTANRCYHYRKSKCGEGEDEFRGKHNKLLHVERPPVESSSNSEFCGQVAMSNSILLRIAPVVIRGPTNEIKTYALFDEGSTCSMIDQELAKDLSLSGPDIPFCFQWTNGIRHYEEDSRTVVLTISAGNVKSTSYRIKNVRTVKNLSLPSQRFNEDDMIRRFPYLNYEILRSTSVAKPLLLLGQDNIDLIMPRKIVQARFNQPVMSKSKLGWTVHGVIEDMEKNETLHVNHCCQHVTDTEELHRLVKDSFRLESFGVKYLEGGIKSEEDKKAITILEKTIRKVGNHYEVGHLWRQEDVTLPNSRQNALNRLLCMEKKMKRDIKFKKLYCEKIAEYVEKNYATKLEISATTESPKTWYLPHFAVWNINKPGKIRLVFDAAAKSFGSSLNSFLLQGPDLVPSLISVLWRFRQGRTAFNGDIKEMFHQVLIKKEDRQAQRFLWRESDSNRPPDVYEMNVMIFGTVSSPCVAQYVKNMNAEKFEEQFPGISRIMKKQHYVDDYLDSCDDEKEAIKRIKNVIYVHQQAGYEMTRWISTSSAVIQSIPEHLRASTAGIKIDSEKIERVLGLSWCPQQGNFIFTLNLRKIPEEISNGKKHPTKREMLQLVMSIFDPLGFLAPLMVKARILLQDVWKNNTEWDEKIGDDLYGRWKQWLEELKQITPLSIPRCYFPKFSRSPNVVDLHLFADASDKAYAAVAFLCAEEKEEGHTSFVSSKFKVAPMNQQTIPKLELQAAVLACRLAKTIKSELEYNIQDVHFWTDSMVVLNQIRSQVRRFPVFVACRIGEIREETECSQWHWVPSEFNYADQATKETNITNLLSSNWYNGPEFLRLGKKYWPVEPKQEREVFIETNLIHTNCEESCLPNILRFSKWTKLIRSTAWILHAIKMIRLSKRDRPQTLTLATSDIKKATKLWEIQSQKETFEEELRDLGRVKTLLKTSRLFKLSAFLDEEGILRLGGRLFDADIDYDSKYPIILSPKHRYTQLLIDYYHAKAGHFGIETVVNNIRTKYWILHIRSAVKKSFRRCQICQVRKCKPVVSEMGNLPKERLETFVFPFTYVGIDFFGPIKVSIGRRLEKRYGVLFTCLTIRAIHIEVAASLDTSSTILAIRRFMCRRGQPKEFITDNGTNFVGAERELRVQIKSLNYDQISDHFSADGIEWKFNPPASPHMGGVWERMVRSVKTALRFSLKSINPKEEVLQTLLVEAEYIINSRPLTHISVDPVEPEAITPNHFLLLRSGQVKSFGDDVNVLTRKQWRFAESLANLYWKRWIKEYRPLLIKRPKWHQKIEPVKTDDIVVIVDENLPRNEWLLGRIEKIFKGKDGTPRVAQVTTKKGTYTRPVAKLCVLPTDG